MASITCAIDVGSTSFEIRQNPFSHIVSGCPPEQACDPINGQCRSVRRDLARHLRIPVVEQHCAQFPGLARLIDVHTTAASNAAQLRVPGQRTLHQPYADNEHPLQVDGVTCGGK